MEKKINRLYNFLGIIALSVILTFAVSAMVFSNDAPSSTINAEGINYYSNVCIEVIGEEGDVKQNECSSNVLYNTGAELIEGHIGNEVAADAADQIQLCNATAGCGTPVAAASEDFTAYTDCGLSEAAGSYASNGNGNWSISNTFTASCDNLVTNSTRLRNGAGTNFAGNSFSVVTLQTNDQLTINWTIWVQ